MSIKLSLSPTLALVGCGPRGLYFLNALSKQLRIRPSLAPLHVIIFEPLECGVGPNYRKDQPSFLEFNSGVRGPTAYEDGEGPSLSEWLLERGEEIWPSTRIPRRVYGQYLREAFQKVTSSLPQGLTWQHFPEPVEDIQPLTPSEGWQVKSSQRVIQVEAVVLALGHTPVSSFYEKVLASFSPHGCLPSHYFSELFPLHNSLDKVGSQEKVALIGMGHAAIDGYMAASIGRGGSFERQPSGELLYIPSGEEPKIFALSGSGLPFSAKLQVPSPRTPELFSVPPLAPKYLTAETVATLRREAFRETDSFQLDFKRQILPLIQKEMAYAFYATSYGEEVAEKIVTTPGWAQKLAPADRFSWEKLINPLPKDAYTSPKNYRSALLNFMEEDLKEAAKGCLSPLKRACQTLDGVLRGILGNIVAFGGCTPSSHQFYKKFFHPLRNRVAVGIHYYKAEEILALIKAGIVDVFSGPGPQLRRGKEGFTVQSQLPGIKVQVEYVIETRLPHADLTQTKLPVLQSLLKQGTIREYINRQEDEAFATGALDMTENFEAISQDGQIVPGLYVMGPLTEGKRFYTYITGRENEINGPFFEARTLSEALLAYLSKRI